MRETHFIMGTQNLTRKINARNLRPKCRIKRITRYKKRNSSNGITSRRSKKKIRTINK